MRQFAFFYLSLAFFSMAIGFSSCSTLAANENDKKKSEEKTEDKAKTLQYFDTVNLSGVGNLYIKQSNKPNFTVEADKKVLPLANVYVKDKTLYIDLKNATEENESKINYYLNVKNLKNIYSSSSSTIFIEESFATDTLNVTLSSFGEANLFLDVKKLNINIEEGGKAILKGRALDQTVSIKGAGEFNGSHLVGENAFIQIDGSGLVITNVSNNLNAKLSGDNTVKYCGKPAINKEISGKASVQAASDQECK